MAQDRDAPAERAQTFEFGAIRRAADQVAFDFSCSRFGVFSETVAVGATDVVPDGLLTLLQVALGVSTYKAAAARRVIFPPLTPGGRAMAEALYTEGLAEFFVRSGLSYPPQTAFEGPLVPAAAADPRRADGAPLVAFGGGKDSYVAGAIAERALGTRPVFASVILSEAVGEVLTATAPYPPLLVRRRLDPRLLSLEGAYTGHVPITAINILVLTVAGLLRGSGPILFANERSADEPTMIIDGVPANHQYSKSSAFEALVRQAVAEAAPHAPETFSVLRPFSELWIARRFAAISDAFGRFTSCNRNFRLAGDAAKRWCGACAKCAFTSLILSRFIDREDALSIFGRVFLDEDALQPFYRELCGLSTQKPWDCVGTIAECQAALMLLARHQDWSSSRVVRDLLPELLRERSEEDLDARARDAFAPRGRDALPETLYEAALELPCV